MKLDPGTIKVIVACFILTIIFSLIMRHIMEKNGVYDPLPNPPDSLEKTVSQDESKE